MKKVGTVTHYYGNIGVAIVELSDALAVGDTIHIGELEQAIDSMQVEHTAVEKAKKGDIVGIKVAQRVREGSAVERE